MAKHSKDKMRENQSEQSKEDSSTLIDYLIEESEKLGTPVKSGKLLKNWSRVIFKA